VNADLSTYDLERLQGLAAARRRATGLLIAVTALFASTFAMGDATWVGFLRRTSEAAMIGGMADWFAVTALFRHPLGIPIPHTAVIPRSKEGLGRNLGEFVRNNFLAPDQIVERLQDAHLPERAGVWLSNRDNSDLLAGRLATTLGAIAEGMDADSIESDLERMVVERLRSLPVAELVGRSMQAAIADGQHQGVLTSAILGIASTMDENRTALRRRLGQESPWWVPDAIDDAVFARAYDTLHRFLEEMAANPDHEIRHTIDDRLAELAQRLQSDPELAHLVAVRVEELAEHPELRKWARGTWSQMAGALVEASTRPDSRLRKRIAAALVQLGERLVEDPSLQARIDAWLASLAPPLARVGQQELGDLIAATVDRWDPEDTSRRLELWMGRDLQFVRINGTLVGALIGLVIHTVVTLLGGAP